MHSDMALEGQELGTWESWLGASLCPHGLGPSLASVDRPALPWQMERDVGTLVWA